jgi:RNA polymerase sigma factor (sigma-70 family)
MNPVNVTSKNIKDLKLSEEEQQEIKEKTFLKESVRRIINDLDFLMDSYKRFESRAKYDIDTLNQSFHKNLDSYLLKVAETIIKKINLQLEEEVSKYIKDLMNFILKREQYIIGVLQEIKKDTTKKIHLDLTMDGYEMVKRTPATDELEIETIAKFNAEKAVEDLLNTLTKREKVIMCMRFGVLGEKESTFHKISRAIGISNERCSQIVMKCLRKLRHVSRENLVKQITHKSLKEAITGQK